jgi:tetratricopeptide (TPR) repeat protein
VIILNHKGAKALKIILCLCVLVQAQTPSEADALAAIKLATNPTTKLAAAEDFIARFPNSNARLSIAEQVSAEILKVKNGAVALALLERARAVFTTDQEREVFKPVTLGAYALGNRPDDAFALASEMLAKSPDDLSVLVRMTQVGSDEVRKRNRKHAEVALQYGLKAIALIEAGTTHEADLAQLYQQTAILYLATGNTEEAKSRLTKASTLAPQDPSNFALLGRVINADYVSKEQDVEVLDTIIDAYARAVGLAMGRAEYQQLLQQVLPDLTTYYKQRHGSIKGLKQLINKFSQRD